MIKYMNSFLPVSLTFFSADTGNENGDQTQNNSGGQEPPNNTEQTNQGTGDQTPPEDKTFTQEDVNNVVAKESRKATEKVLKDLGIEDFENAKEGMEKFKEWQESQQTEQEKQEKAMKSLQMDNESLKQEKQTLVSQISAMKAGVKGESVEDVVALAERRVTDKVSIDDAIKQVIKDYPHFTNVAAENNESDNKPNFLSGQHGSDSNTNVDPFEAIKQKYK